MHPMLFSWKPLLCESGSSPICWLTRAICFPSPKDLKTYQAGIDVGANDGVNKAFTFQATPGAFFYRRSIAKECLGTDDPAEIQAMVV